MRADTRKNKNSGQFDSYKKFSSYIYLLQKTFKSVV